MSAIAAKSDAFLNHLVAVLSIYELGPFPAPVPRYDGPADWQTENILRALGAMARRMCTAEEGIAALKASENWQYVDGAPDTKKRRSVGDSPDLGARTSAPHAYGANHNTHTNHNHNYTHSLNHNHNHHAALVVHSNSAPSFFPPFDTLSRFPVALQDTDTDTIMADPESDGRPSYRAAGVGRTPSVMSISLDGVAASLNPSKMAMFNRQVKPGPSASAPPTSHADHVTCPTCGKTITDALTLSRMPRPEDTPVTSPLVVPPGPLAAAAYESGMSAVEELKLLKAQVQDVARVCNAVARGDLSQKITVPVQGVVMVQLKDVINTMVDKLGLFAREVTRVSQEVGTEGCVLRLRI